MSEQDQTLGELVSAEDANRLTERAKQLTHDEVQAIMDHDAARGEGGLEIEDLQSVMDVATARANRGESLLTYSLDLSAHLQKNMDQLQGVRFVCY